MEFPSFSLQITPIEEEFDFGDCFSIIFNCTKKLIQIIESSNPGAEVQSCCTTSTAREAILVPSEILCSGTPLTHLSREDTILLQQICSSLSVSPHLLDQILSNIVQTARSCDSNTREIVVNLHVTSYNVVQDSDAECAICLEKFEHGNEDSSVEIVRTNCKHVFHDRCLLRWLRRCANCESPYSCPLCRRIIFQR
ncbi:hypothetical protein HN51_042162 [Arachis hypogaea]|uniref:Uncharacterized protein LOC107495458 n=2 Tax=Arachis TaxID=3817 RepID=A0A6P4E0V8_ARADU|nr:uncharacterized protein LOC107495458 [Arachis duranensis]XP_020981604.1 uncharacterized protein LOC110273075 [Arachis duranensis]XP_025704053.1 uncharacterized protein LOC112805952 [Arachis hypogaea]RYR05999.1 hypothetical protein Ahy_B06g085805 [Arachis hypogaea]